MDSMSIYLSLSLYLSLYLFLSLSLSISVSLSIYLSNSLSSLSLFLALTTNEPPEKIGKPESVTQKIVTYIRTYVQAYLYIDNNNNKNN